MLVINWVLLRRIRLGVRAYLTLTLAPPMYLCCLDMWGLLAMLGLTSVSTRTVGMVKIALILTVCQSVGSAVGVSVVGIRAAVSAVHAGRADMKS